MKIINLNHTSLIITANLKALQEAIDKTLKNPTEEHMQTLQDHAFKVADILSRIYRQDLDLEVDGSGLLNTMARQKIITENIYMGCIDIINFDTDFLDNVDGIKILETYVNNALNEEK